MWTQMDGLRFIFSSVTLDFSFVTGEEKKMAEGFKRILVLSSW